MRRGSKQLHNPCQLVVWRSGGRIQNVGGVIGMVVSVMFFTKRAAHSRIRKKWSVTDFWQYLGGSKHPTKKRPAGTNIHVSNTPKHVCFTCESCMFHVISRAPTFALSKHVRFTSKKCMFLDAFSVQKIDIIKKTLKYRMTALKSMSLS